MFVTANDYSKKQNGVRLVSFEVVRTEAEDLHYSDMEGWKQLIETYFLSEKERKVLSAQCAAILDRRRQRELSIIYGQQQPNLCIRMKWVVNKLARLHRYLSSDLFFEEYDNAKKVVTPKQYESLGLYMAGNRMEDIATWFDVSYTNITLLRSRIVSSLTEYAPTSPKDFPAFKLLPNFIREYKYNFKYVKRG